MLIDINNAYERVVSLILQSDGRWQWDDTNQTDLPIATTTVTASQQDYALAVSHLKIDHVELKDSNGNWAPLTPYDNEDFDGSPITQQSTATGVPTHYDVLGNSVFLYPAPNFTQAASIKVYFQRGPAVFTTGEVSTGTKIPGFNSLYHDLIPLWVAYNYAISNGLPTANGFLAAIERQEKQLVLDYSKRNPDDRQIMKMRGISHI